MIVFVIKKIRLNKNISLRRLSLMTDISRTYLRNLENNRRVNPSIRILTDIAEALEVNIKDLFYTIADIDELREKMHNSIEENGIDSKETLEISHLIDLLINIKMNKELN